MPPCARSAWPCSRRTSTSRSSRTSSRASARRRSATTCSTACRPASRSSRSSTTSSSRCCRPATGHSTCRAIPRSWRWSACRAPARRPRRAKLARHVVKLGRRPLLVAADPYRPAAADQLETLGKEPRHPGLSRTGRHVGRGHRPRRRRGGQAPGPRRGHPRHRRPAVSRRGADGRDRRRQRGGPPGRDAARRRRDDRPGGRGGRPGVRRRGPGQRPDPDQDRRRCPRWRGAVDLGGHRRPGQVPRHRREDRRARGLPSRPARRPDPRAWATS